MRDFKNLVKKQIDFNFLVFDLLVTCTSCVYGNLNFTSIQYPIVSTLSWYKGKDGRVRGCDKEREEVGRKFLNFEFCFIYILVYFKYKTKKNKKNPKLT